MYFLSQKLMSTNKFECNEFEKYIYTIQTNIQISSIPKTC